VRAAAGVVSAALAIVVALWGIGLIWKALSGGMPDSSPRAIVVIGVILVLCGIAFAVSAVTMLGRWRRSETSMRSRWRSPR
jgi:uncharacterized membrane protein YidH (DUF202 family)